MCDVSVKAKPERLPYFSGFVGRDNSNSRASFGAQTIGRALGEMIASAIRAAAVDPACRTVVVEGLTDNCDTCGGSGTVSAGRFKSKRCPACRGKESSRTIAAAFTSALPSDCVAVSSCNVTAGVVAIADLLCREAAQHRRTAAGGFLDDESAAGHVRWAERAERFADSLRALTF